MTKPTKFKYNGFNWKINWLDKISPNPENFGKTELDMKEMDIYSRGIPDEVLKDTLLHELIHVLLEDIISIIKDADAPSDRAEEHLVRLVTPRMNMLFSENPKLRSYLWD